MGRVNKRKAAARKRAANKKAAEMDAALEERQQRKSLERRQKVLLTHKQPAQPRTRRQTAQAKNNTGAKGVRRSTRTNPVDITLLPNNQLPAITAAQQQIFDNLTDIQRPKSSARTYSKQHRRKSKNDNEILFPRPSPNNIMKFNQDLGPNSFNFDNTKTVSNPLPPRTKRNIKQHRERKARRKLTNYEKALRIRRQRVLNPMYKRYKKQIKRKSFPEKPPSPHKKSFDSADLDLTMFDSIVRSQNRRKSMNSPKKTPSPPRSGGGGGSPGNDDGGFFPPPPSEYNFSPLAYVSPSRHEDTGGDKSSSITSSYYDVRKRPKGSRKEKKGKKGEKKQRRQAKKRLPDLGTGKAPRVYPYRGNRVPKRGLGDGKCKKDFKNCPQCEYHYKSEGAPIGPRCCLPASCYIAVKVRNERLLKRMRYCWIHAIKVHLGERVYSETLKNARGKSVAAMTALSNVFSSRVQRDAKRPRTASKRTAAKKPAAATKPRQQRRRRSPQAHKIRVEPFTKQRLSDIRKRRLAKKISAA